MSLRYIGSKTRVADQIVALLGPPPKGGARFIDAFCGTGAVAEAAALAGWPIHINDHLLSAVTVARARLISRDGAKFRKLGGYAEAIAHLNDVPSVRGFIYREYSPASENHSGVARMYFTRENAVRIDGVRSQIAAWRAGGVITEDEECLLVGDLLLATNRVANIAGTYGCFLSHWSPQSLEAFRLRPRELFPTQIDVRTTVGDVMAVRATERDVVYLDPPYTKRQYAAYYHLLETIAAGDQPVVAGVTGLRPWRAKASDFCYRSRALNAIVRLVESQAAKRVFLSYSSEGHVALEPLANALARVGDVSVNLLRQVGRYRPNLKASTADVTVTEYLFAIDRVPDAAHRLVSA